MRRNLALFGGAAAGTVAGLLFRRRRVPTAPIEAGPDPRAEELRRKLEQAREGAADAEDFEAAGMGAETILEDEPTAEVDDARRRVHDAARAAAEEMRGGGEQG